MMAIYTVHEPPRREADRLGHTERFVFVRDGFSWPAFLFGPLWMLRHRLWLVLLGYLIIVGGLTFGLRAVGIPAVSVEVVYGLVALLIGIEASTLRRWTLARRRWITLSVVVGDDIEAAERRFFDAWVKGVDVSRLPPDLVAPAAHVAHVPGAATQDVLGLFPEPGARS
jgi:Protein of unknown function (DUF2628)